MNTIEKGQVLVNQGFHQHDGKFIRMGSDGCRLVADLNTDTVVRQDKHGRETSPAWPLRWPPNVIDDERDLAHEADMEELRREQLASDCGGDMADDYEDDAFDFDYSSHDEDEDE